MRNDLAGTEFERRLETAKAEGAAGREELLEQLARMPMDRLIALPASSLAILGPQGLARLAAKREDLAGTARRVAGRPTRLQPASVSRSRVVGKARPVRFAAMMVLSLLVIGMLTDITRPVLVPSIFDPGIRTRETSRWPACRRLDRHVDGCVYSAGGANLSLGRVASLTGIPVDQVSGANRHLSVAPETALPRGSRIVVWRGRQKLSGASQ
jgi:hypothetical protein